MGLKGTLSRVWPSALNVSRRQWLRKAAVAGGGLGLISSLPQRAPADDGDEENGGCILQAQCGQPLPIPHLTTIPFGSFHFFFPGPADASANPSVITDFRGVIGQADLDLTGTGTDTTTGLTGHYAFHTDMRFMKGQFVALDGKVHTGAFAFIWLDSTASPLGPPTPSTTSSLGPHSYDPGVLPSLGFWITAIPEDSIEFEFDEASASMKVRDVCVFDAFTIPNSLTANHPLYGIGRAKIDSLVLRWSGIKRTVHVHDVADKFSGDFIEDSATVQVMATTQASSPPLTIGAFHGFRFVSDAAVTTHTNFAQIGKMQDGVFFV